MENYVSSFPFSSSSSSPPPSSLLSLNPSSSGNNNIFVSENNNNNNNNNSLRLGYSTNLMKISSNNNQGFLGLMSEMDQQVQGNNTSSGTSVASHVISLDSENKLGINDNNCGVKKIKGEKKAKKPKYAFQTRSQVDILDDGYRWRKYGQKAVKNNKFPRSYYRCTHQGCNVKKQVQRLTKDEEVVVTTYEGMHSHSIDKSTDNFEHILSQMQIYSSF